MYVNLICALPKLGNALVVHDLCMIYSSCTCKMPKLDNGTVLVHYPNWTIDLCIVLVLHLF
jgi:hypothetical protein